MTDNAKPTVLVIDDEAGPRESLRFLLDQDYRVLCADSVARGLDLLRMYPPDTVIMDIRMPGRDGIAGLRDIRAFDADVAVIMLTGYGALETAREAVRHQANDYMEKPFETAEMRAAVARHVAATRARRRRERLLVEAHLLQRRLAEVPPPDHRLVELGRLSAEYIHDLRNKLNVVCSAAQLLRVEVRSGLEAVEPANRAEIEQALGAMEETVHTCTELLDAWQGVTRHQPASLRPFPLVGVVRAAVEGCRPAAVLARARLAFDDATGAAAIVRGDPVQLARAVTNLVQNAIQALDAADGEVRVTLARQNGHVRLNVADSGHGIAPTDLKRVFEAGFTTRADRGGTGLGLSVVREVVEAHGGTVAIESVPGKGTTVSVTLPACPAPPPPAVTA